MAYVSVPKDLTKVKNKVAFNLTKRQLICIGIGAAMGIPSYFLLRNVMGNSNAATVMVLLMLPAFLFAMYEKDGMHLEDVLMHMIRVKFLRPPVRKYETENYYETDPEQIIVPSMQQATGSGAPFAADSGASAVSSGGAVAHGRVDINAATVDQLQQLNGVGPALAQRIIADRQANGPFKTVEDLKRVSGIGDKKFASLADSICVG